MKQMEKDNTSKGAFIIIKDQNIAKKFIADGFEQIQNNIPNVYTFVNIKSSTVFNEIDEGKIKYSNVLCM